MNNFVFKDRIDIVLIDWHGVLSNRGFWCDQSKQNESLNRWCNKIFKKKILNDWMRGTISFEEICKIGVNYGLSQKIITDAFDMDVGQYGPRWEICFAIDKLFPRSKKILFSENPLLFKNNFLATNKPLMNYFDDIILSCDYGVLKEDQSPNLFDIALKKFNLNNFRNAVLIDDKLVNCANFKKMNGHVININ